MTTTINRSTAIGLLSQLEWLECFAGTDQHRHLAAEAYGTFRMAWNKRDVATGDVAVPWSPEQANQIAAMIRLERPKHEHYTASAITGKSGG
jgi:hypothetical protein